MSKKSVPSPLPNYLPLPGEHLQKLLPLAHESLASVLGLAWAYLQAMHPVKVPRSDAKLAVSAHIMSLFLNDPLIQAVLPPAASHAATSRELTALQAKMSSLEASIALLAKSHKDPITPPTPSAQPAQPNPARGKAPGTLPTYAAKASSPQCPSIVVGAAAYTWTEEARPSLADLCTTINRTLVTSPHAQVLLSATKWTQKGNLVIWGGPNTTAHHLSAALPTISEALQASLSALADSSPPLPPSVRPNVKWSRALLNGVSTGHTASKGAHTPDECHQALIA